jgi:hypothetical protein
LHPRDPETSGYYDVPRALAAEVLAFVRDQGPTHPADLEERFGRERAVNGWGGFSKATTRALQHLQYHGQLRVAGRRDGIRIYEAATPHADPLPPEERARQLVLLVVGILAPLAEAGLASTFGLLGRGAPGLGGWRKTVAAMVASGALESGEVDGERYYWPAGAATRRNLPDAVRLLAPFDPIVWERRRFQHFWGWEYRFEAYTKPDLRRFGYYAMPLLWRDAIIGWANVRISDGKLDVDLGYIGARPKDLAFRQALDAELAAMESFLT